MSKLRKFLVQTVLASIGILMLDIENPPEPWTQEKADGFVRSMNRFMPLTDEILLLGIKGAFKEISILHNFGRNPGLVKAFDLDASEAAEYRELEGYADRLADSHPYYQLMLLDVFSSTCGHVPIMPDSQDVIILSVSREDGEVGLLDIREGSFTGSDHSDEFYGDKSLYKDYDYLACCRVIKQAWPD